MNLNIYFHGRPQGQDIWTLNGCEKDTPVIKSYLENTIGKDVPDVMIVELYKGRSSYTYLHRRNVLEYSGRPVAYMAITVCFEGMYCKNASKLFDLLSQVYKRMLSGKILTQGEERFTMAQFNGAEDLLKQTSDVIDQNIHDPEIGFVLSGLENQPDTRNSSVVYLSIKDSDSPAFNDVVMRSRVAVSPSYPSKDDVHNDDMRRIEPLKNEVDALKSSLAGLTAKYEATLTEKDTLSQQRKDLQNTIAQKDEELQTIETRVTNKYKEEINILKSDIESRKKELQQVKDEKVSLEKKLHDKDRQLQDKDKQLQKQKVSITSGSGSKVPDGPIGDEQEKLLRRMAERFPMLTGNHIKGRHSFVKVISCWMPCVNFVFLVAILVLLVFVRTDTLNHIKENSDFMRTTSQHIDFKMQGSFDADIPNAPADISSVNNVESTSVATQEPVPSPKNENKTCLKTQKEEKQIKQMK